MFHAAHQIETLQTTTHSLENIRGPVDDGVKDAVADLDPRKLPLFASDLARHVGAIEAIPRVVVARDELVLGFRPLWHSRDHGLVPGDETVEHVLSLAKIRRDERLALTQLVHLDFCRLHQLLQFNYGHVLFPRLLG